ATDEQLESAVQQMVRRELLLQQARNLDISLSREEEEAIRQEARAELQELLQGSGLAQFAASRAPAAAIDAQVKGMLQEAVAGRAQLVPLCRLGRVLRDLFPSEVNEGTFPQVVSELEQIRAGQPAPPASGQPQLQMQPRMPPA